MTKTNETLDRRILGLEAHCLDLYEEIDKRKGKICARWAQLVGSDCTVTENYFGKEVIGIRVEGWGILVVDDDEELLLLTEIGWRDLASEIGSHNTWLPETLQAKAMRIQSLTKEAKLISHHFWELRQILNELS